MILITGHEGFVGATLTNKLEQQGLATVGLGKMDKHFKWDAQLFDLFQTHDISVVIACGAISDNQYKGLDIFDWNVYCMQLLARMTAIKSSYLIFLSSQTARYPQTLYGHTKKLAEQMILATQGVNACILQPFNIWGEGENLKPAHCRSLPYRLADHELKVLWQTERDYVHVSDVVAAITHAMTHRTCGTFQIGTGKTVASVVLAEKVGYDGYVREETPDYIEGYTCAQPDKLLPGWKASVDVVAEMPKLECALQSWMEESVNEIDGLSIGLSQS